MIHVPNTDLGLWRGIEFECIFNNYNGVDKFRRFLRNNNYNDFVEIGDDGSIDLDNDDTFDASTAEIKVLFKKGNEKMVRDICRFLRHKAKVNTSCGTHVHFDMRHLHESVVKVIGYRLACSIPALKTILPRSRRRNEWCHHDIGEMDGDTRYAFVNLTAYRKYKTIEVRAHSGTLNARKILNWIAICEHIMYNPEVSHCKDIDELCSNYKFKRSLKKYIRDRYDQVNAVTPPPEQ